MGLAYSKQDLLLHKPPSQPVPSSSPLWSLKVVKASRTYSGFIIVDREKCRLKLYGRKGGDETAAAEVERHLKKYIYGPELIPEDNPWKHYVGCKGDSFPQRKVELRPEAEPFVPRALQSSSAEGQALGDEGKDRHMLRAHLTKWLQNDENKLGSAEETSVMAQRMHKDSMTQTSEWAACELSEGEETVVAIRRLIGFFCSLMWSLVSSSRNSAEIQGLQDEQAPHLPHLRRHKY